MYTLGAVYVTGQQLDAICEARGGKLTHGPLPSLVMVADHATTVYTSPWSATVILYLLLRVCLVAFPLPLEMSLRITILFLLFLMPAVHWLCL